MKKDGLNNKGKTMIIIAFAPKSSKILPNIFCKNFKHCAIIVRDKQDFILYQFSGHNRVTKIIIRTRDIRILGAHGWRFIYMPREIKSGFNPNHAWTCVGMVKNAIGMHRPFIQTPDGLYKKLCD